MNTGISIFRRLNEEFISNFPQFDDHGEIIEYIYYGYCDPNSHEKRDKDFATYTTANFKISSKAFFCDVTYELLRRFFMNGAEMPFYQQEEARTSGLHFTPDDETLLKCLSLFGLVISESKGDFYNDQLIQALHTMKRDETIYTWVVFAVQLFVDTRRILGKELDRCIHETQELQKWMSASVEQCLNFGRTNTVNNWHDINSDSLLAMKQHLEHMLEKDFIQDVLDDYFGARATRYSWGPFYLFRNHPMLLGLITQGVLAKLHVMGIGLGGDQGAIITSIHLYNASQQGSQIPKSRG
jgi:hypothetical protein